MSLQYGDYNNIRELMKPGDIIAFSGKGYIADVIKFFTRSNVTHVGIVFESKVLFPYMPYPVQTEKVQEEKVVDVMESTNLYVDPVTKKQIAGVQRNRLSKRLKYYNGSIWWLPLSNKVRQKMDLKLFINFLLHTEGIKYDYPQAIKSCLDLFDSLDILNLFTYNQENFESFFCSELAAAALEAGGVINRINASEVTPIDLCSFNIYSEDYYQLKGELTAITKFNKISPEGFGIN